MRVGCCTLQTLPLGYPYAFFVAPSPRSSSASRRESPIRTCLFAQRAHSVRIPPIAGVLSGGPGGIPTIYPIRVRSYTWIKCLELSWEDGICVTKHDLIMLASGAALGLVITGIGKWLFAIFDAVVPVSKAPDKLRTALSVKANRSLFWTTLLLLWMLGSTLAFALDKGPITRLTILYGALLTINSCSILGLFLWECQSFSRERRRVKREAAVTTP